MTRRTWHRGKDDSPGLDKGRRVADALVPVVPSALSGEDVQSGATDTRLASLILDHAHDGIVLLDIRGRILWMNPALERMIGWTLEEARGCNPAELINPPGMRPAAAELIDFRYNPDSSLFGKLRVSRHMRRDGSRFWNQQSHALIDLGPDDAQKMVVVSCRDITDEMRIQTALRHVKDDLEHAAHHDDLTGLGNRKKLTQYLASDAARRSLQKGDMGVLLLDLDRFKEINDTLGHAAGDAVLCHTAAGLTSTAQDGDLLCRMGGDEFLMICLSAPGGLVRRAKALHAAATRPLTWKDQTLRPGVSIGVSMLGAMEDGLDLGGEELIRRADQALYSAKEGGRGRTVLYTAALGRRYRAEQALGQDLAEAVEKMQFCVHLQPILHIGKGNVTGCEALLRWRHPTRGLLTPSAFLPAAEQGRLLHEINHQAMNTALDALVALRTEGFCDLEISLNVSSSILAHVEYPALLTWALESRALPPQSVCVEILETTLDNGDEAAIPSAVTSLRQLGVRVALDDFGTGYAGLHHLAALEIDAIKLDRAMIRRLQTDSRTRTMARALMHLCRQLGVEAIATGVETQEQLDILRRARCPKVQGYGFAPPMPLPDFLDWLRANIPLPSPLTMTDTPLRDPVCDSFDEALDLPSSDIM